MCPPTSRQWQRQYNHIAPFIPAITVLYLTITRIRNIESESAACVLPSMSPR